MIKSKVECRYFHETGDCAKIIIFSDGNPVAVLYADNYEQDTVAFHLYKKDRYIGGIYKSVFEHSYQIAWDLDQIIKKIKENEHASNTAHAS